MSPNSESNMMMDLETVSDKHLHELEQLSRDLLAVMRKSKLLDTPLATLLYSLESQAGEVRRARFDKDDSAYSGF